MPVPIQFCHFFLKESTWISFTSAKAVKNESDQSSTEDKQYVAEFSNGEASVHSQSTHTSHFISPNDIGLYIDKQVRDSTKF